MRDSQKVRDSRGPERMDGAVGAEVRPADFAYCDGAVDIMRVWALVDAELGAEDAGLGEDGDDEHADDGWDIQSENPPEDGARKGLVCSLQAALVDGAENVTTQDIARDGKEDGDHGSSPVEQTEDRVGEPGGVGLRRMGRECAIAEHDGRRPRPEKVVVEDEQAGDAPQAVETADLVTTALGGRYHGGCRLLVVIVAMWVGFGLGKDTIQRRRRRSREGHGG